MVSTRPLAPVPGRIAAARPARRRRRRTPVAVAVVVLAALVLAGCWSSGQQSDMDLVNAYRRSQGRSTLTGDQRAMDKAQAWSQHMAATGVLEHTGGGSAIDTRGVTGWCGYYENVGYASSVAAVHTLFTSSSVHRSNMLSPSHRIGTGVYRSGSRYWVTEIYLRNC